MFGFILKSDATRHCTETTISNSNLSCAAIMTSYIILLKTWNFLHMYIAVKQPKIPFPFFFFLFPSLTISTFYFIDSDD